MASRPTLRRELFLSFAVLVTGALLLASAGVVLVVPVLDSPAEALFFILLLLAGDLAVLFLFGRVLLRRTLLDPMDRLVEDVRRIAEGDYSHRVGEAGTQEIQELSDRVNAMAERLIRDQQRLRDNIRSLEETNRELVIARQQMVRSARLATVGTLAAGLAHEIGNPLGAVMGYLDVARGRAEVSEGLVDILESASEEARRIDRIMRGLLDYARPRGEVREAAEPGAIVPRVLSLLEAQGRLGGVRVEWEPSPEAPALMGDPHHLEQIMVNLLLNAVDALEGTEDPTIFLRVEERPGEGAALPRRREGDPPGINYAHRRRVSSVSPSGVADPLETAERVVRLSVADNGPGLTDDVLDEIFDPFFTTKPPGKGTGLGLAVCARLVADMGGRIEAGRREGGGARFTLTFPALIDETGEAAEVPLAGPPTSREKGASA